MSGVFGPPKEIISSIYEVTPEALEQIAQWLELRGLRMATSSLVGGGVALPVKYSTFTPTWGSSGVAPAIGDATVKARYTQVGKMVSAQVQIVFGAASTFGTGNYTFALPVLASANAYLGGTAFGVDASTGNVVLAAVTAVSTSTVSMLYGGTYLGVFATVGQTAPWAWAQSDSLAWNIVYEAA